MSLLLLAFAAGSATTLTGIRRAQLWRLQSSDLEAGLKLEARIAAARSALSITQVLAVVGAVSTAMLLASDLSGDRGWAAVTAGLGIPLAILAVEIPARIIASRNSERFLPRIGLLIALLNSAMRPLARVLPFSSEAVFSYSMGYQSEQVAILEDVRRLNELLAERETTPELAGDERRMIRSILALRETAVKEIMIPRPDMTTISTEAGILDVARLIVETGHNRIPLYEGSLDTIVGVLYARNVFQEIQSGNTSISLQTIALAAIFVPETKKAHELLREFLGSSVHFALVADEYGGIEGIVTLEDLLEEIVGEIEQEHQRIASPITRLSEVEAVISGKVSLDEVNEVLGTNLRSEGFDTIGGFTLHYLGRMPERGDRLEAEGVAIEVLSIVGRRVRQLLVRSVSAQEESPRTS
jgi:CBS domain containing-hemolysin-like protein